MNPDRISDDVTDVAHDLLRQTLLHADAVKQIRELECVRDNSLASIQLLRAELGCSVSATNPIRAFPFIKEGSKVVVVQWHGAKACSNIVSINIVDADGNVERR